MSKKERITIEVSVDSIRQALKKVIKSEYAPIIVDAIVKHLEESEIGLEDLYHSLMGVERTFAFKPLDEVWVSIEHLPSWRMDKVKTIAAGLVFKDSFMKCKVVEINALSRTCYRLEFECIPTGKDEKRTEDYWLPPSLISGQYIEEEDLLPF